MLNPFARYVWQGGPFDGRRTRWLGVLLRVYRRGDAYTVIPADRSPRAVEFRDVLEGLMTLPGVYRCDDRAARVYVWHPMRSQFAQFGTMETTADLMALVRATYLRFRDS